MSPTLLHDRHILTFGRDDQQVICFEKTSKLLEVEGLKIESKDISFLFDKSKSLSRFY